MKTLVNFLVAFLFVSLPGLAQEGIIEYEVKMNLHLTLPKEREGMKSMIPEFNVSKQALYFNSEASLYKRMVDEEAEAEAMATGGGGGTFRLRMGGNNELYLQPSAQKRVSLREFNGKKYLVQDTLSILPWKLEPETKTILGYTCKKATYVDEARKQTVVAWYTDQLRPFLGPDSYGTLPGAVLEINVNDGERTITALKVDTRKLKKGELAEPQKGEKITEKQYQAMLTEQMERMRREGGMIIRR